MSERPLFQKWVDHEVETGITLLNSVVARLGPWSDRRETYIRKILKQAFDAGEISTFEQRKQEMLQIRAQAFREGQESMRERCAGVADNHILRGLVTNSVAYKIRQLEPEPEQ